MVVFILQRVSPSLRGELTRWLVQPHTGVYVGTVSGPRAGSALGPCLPFTQRRCCYHGLSCID